MKPFHKRLNRRKSSKVTLKTHSKDTHPDLQDTKTQAGGAAEGVRPEDIKFHQHF